MAPYLGLISGRSEVSARGYTRKDLSDVSFRISPADEKTLIVLNWDRIEWSGVKWPLQGQALTNLAVYPEVDIGDVMTSCNFGGGTLSLRPGDSLAIGPGMLRFDHVFTNDEGTKKNITETKSRLEQMTNVLHRIANAPSSTSAEALRRIARRALERVND